MVEVPVIVALIGLAGAVVLAMPGFLSWRVSRANSAKLEAAATAAATAAAAALEAKRIADAVKYELRELGIKVDGRLSELLVSTARAASATGRAEGVAAEQERTATDTSK